MNRFSKGKRVREAEKCKIYEGEKKGKRETEVRNGGGKHSMNE